MASNTLTSFAGALKETTAKEGVSNLLNESQVLLAQLDSKNKKAFEFGAYGRLAMKVGRGGAASFVTATGATLPTPKAMDIQSPKIYPKYLLGAVNIDDTLIEQAAGGETAFANALQSVKDDAMGTVKKSMTVSLYKNGNGFLSGFLSTDVGGAAGAWTVEVDDVNAFYRGMVVDFVTSAGVDVTADLAISNVNRKTNTITVDQTAALGAITATDKIVYQNSYSYAINGLEDNLNDASYGSTFFGLSRTAYTALNIQFFGGTSATQTAELTEDMIAEALDWPMESGSGGNPELSIWDPALVRKYSTKLMGMKRYVNEIALKGGYKALPYSNNGKDCAIVVDPHCPKSYIYFLNPSTFTLYQLAGLDWVNLDSGGNIMRLKSTSMVYESFVKYYANLGCDNPPANVVMRHLS